MTTPEAALKLKKHMAATRANSRRRAQRDQLWPDSAFAVFQRITGGYAQIPRTVPMIATLLDELGGKSSKPGRLYVVLWSYDYNDGMVEVHDPVQIAAEAGYITDRAERTFGERMRQLRDWGFIRTAPLGPREFGFVLLLDPHQAIVNMRARNPSSIREEWWSAFAARCNAIGITLPAAQETQANAG